MRTLVVQGLVVQELVVQGLVVQELVVLVVRASRPYVMYGQDARTTQSIDRTTRKIDRGMTRRQRRRIGPRSVSMLVSVFLLAAICGCPPRANNEHFQQVQSLQRANDDLKRQLAARDEQNRAQAGQIQELQGLTGERAVEKLVRVSQIEIERLSGGFDENRDAVPDGIVIYLRLYDDLGDAIKAAGAARVRVLDLSKPEGEQVVAEASRSADELRTVWYGKLLTYHYTIRLPFRAGIDPRGCGELTAFAEFHELLTGRVFAAQAPIDLRVLAAEPTAKRSP